MVCTEGLAPCFPVYLSSVRRVPLQSNKGFATKEETVAAFKKLRAKAENKVNRDALPWKFPSTDESLPGCGSLRGLHCSARPCNVMWQGRW